MYTVQALTFVAAAPHAFQHPLPPPLPPSNQSSVIAGSLETAHMVRLARCTRSIHTCSYSARGRVLPALLAPSSTLSARSLPGLPFSRAPPPLISSLDCRSVIEAVSSGVGVTLAPSRHRLPLFPPCPASLSERVLGDSGVHSPHILRLILSPLFFNTVPFCSDLCFALLAPGYLLVSTRLRPSRRFRRSRAREKLEWFWGSFRTGCRLKREKSLIRRTTPSPRWEAEGLA